MIKFSDRYIKALQPKEKIYEVSEPGGFGLRVRPTGSKMFFFKYRKGQLKRITLGQYPSMSLRAARMEHARLWDDLKNGLEPTKEKAITENTFSLLSGEYLDKKAKKTKAERSWKEDERIITKDLVPHFGESTAGSISRRDILLFLEGLRDVRKLGRQVNIVHGLIRRIYRFGLEREFPGVEFNPAADIGRIGTEGEKDRALTADEIAMVWHGLPRQKINESTYRCLMFILATGQRPGECLNIDRLEIEGNWWTIPQERMKTGKTRKDKIREHRVFLTPLAMELLGSRDKLPYPFPVPAQVSALSYALRRSFSEVDLETMEAARKMREKGLSPSRIGVMLGMSSQKVGALLSPTYHIRLTMDPFTPHDLRRTAATMMAENGVPQETIDKVLGHTMEKVRRTYNRYSYDQEKQQAMMVLEAAILRAISAPLTQNL